MSFSAQPQTLHRKLQWTHLQVGQNDGSRKMWKSVHCICNEFCGRRAEKPHFLLSCFRGFHVKLHERECVSAADFQWVRRQHVCRRCVPVAVQALQQWGFTCGFSWFKAALRVGGVALCWGNFIFCFVSWHLRGSESVRASVSVPVCVWHTLFCFFYGHLATVCRREWKRRGEQGRRKVNRGQKGRGRRRWAEESSRNKKEEGGRKQDGGEEGGER